MESGVEQARAPRLGDAPAVAERLSYAERVDEILRRYPPGDPVHRAGLVARPVLAESVSRTLSRLRSTQPR